VRAQAPVRPRRLVWDRGKAKLVGADAIGEYVELAGDPASALVATTLESATAGGTPWPARCLDVVLTVFMAPVILIAGAAIALAIYIDSPGPVIYRSRRVGRGGQPFEMLKFRKMRRDASSGPLTREDDDRFTPIGRFLAATRLDELPQAWNVLRGEMRLVGPRPELECFVAQFPDQYAEILTVTPGVTGNSQLRFVDERLLLDGPDPESTYCEHVLPVKIEIDLGYARSHPLAGDLLILAKTAALPTALLRDRLHRRSGFLRVWLPTAAAAVLFALVFVLVSSQLP
jgi:lipopolysaccharide/colanic/teichoic acid biosynthesis glycosyltransferase